MIISNCLSNPQEAAKITKPCLREIHADLKDGEGKLLLHFIPDEQS